MMIQNVLPLFGVAVLLGQGTPPPPPPSPPAVVQQQPRPAPKTYNETADAREVIATAVKHAATDGTRVLINWGANDDAGSATFKQALRPPDVPSTLFSDEYVSVYVDVGHLDRNLDLAKTYGATLKAGDLPALTILDDKGKVLANATAKDFFADEHSAFNKPAIASFLTKYQAPQPNDTVTFQNAVKQAKKDGKTVFVWFSAPW